MKHVSAWGTAQLYYNPQEVVKAWGLMLAAKDKLKYSDTYQFDLVDISRQALADYGKAVHRQMIAAYDARDKRSFENYSNRFLELIGDQNELLSTRSEFLLGKWLRQARAAGTTDAEKDLFEQNARYQITERSTVGGQQSTVGGHVAATGNW